MRSRTWLAVIILALGTVSFGTLVISGCPNPDPILDDDDTGDDDTGDDDDTSPSDICDDFPSEIICDGQDAVTCDEYGDIVDVDECDVDAGITCFWGLGCVSCFPGQRWCVDDAVVECNADGMGFFVVEDCDVANGEVCEGGACIELCQQAEDHESTIGCQFYAIDTDQHDSGPETIQYAVALSNVNEALTAQAAVETFDGNTWNSQWSGAIGPLALETIELPDRHVDDTAIHQYGAYRVTSTIPIIAYQFNPVNGASSYLSDASLLLPVPSWDSVYRVPGWDEANDGFGLQHSSLNVIASVDGTQVTVTPTCNTLSGNGVAAGAPGVPVTATLNAGDYLQIASNGANTNLAGTLIETDANTPVGVFAGHECALIPTNSCCCDHLEEQVFGIQTWGESYVAARIPHRGPPPEASLWQIVTGNDPVELTFTAHADVLGLPANGTVIQPGEALRFEVNGSTANPGDFEVTGTDAFLLTQYMLSSQMAANATGDPAMVQAVPVEQYLDSYVVLVPGTWVNDYLIITRAVGETVTIDGTSVDAWPNWSESATIGAGGYEAVRVLVADGVHVLEGSMGFGVVVVGFDTYDSYAYPGGLNQERINDL